MHTCTSTKKPAPKPESGNMLFQGLEVSGNGSCSNRCLFSSFCVINKSNAKTNAFKAFSVILYCSIYYNFVHGCQWSEKDFSSFKEIYCRFHVDIFPLSKFWKQSNTAHTGTIVQTLHMSNLADNDHSVHK